MSENRGNSVRTAVEGSRFVLSRRSRYFLDVRACAGGKKGVWPKRGKEVRWKGGGFWGAVVFLSFWRQKGGEMDSFFPQRGNSLGEKGRGGRGIVLILKPPLLPELRPVSQGEKKLILLAAKKALSGGRKGKKKHGPNISNALNRQIASFRGKGFPWQRVHGRREGCPTPGVATLKGKLFTPESTVKGEVKIFPNLVLGTRQRREGGKLSRL